MHRRMSQLSLEESSGFRTQLFDFGILITGIFCKDIYRNYTGQKASVCYNMYKVMCKYCHV